MADICNSWCCNNFLCTSKNSYSILWLPGGKGQGNPNKIAVSSDTANDTDLIQKQLKLHGIYELHSILIYQK